MPLCIDDEEIGAGWRCRTARLREVFGLRWPPSLGGTMPRLSIPESTLFRDLDGEAVLVNVESGEYFGLNETGSEVWRLVVEGVPTEQIPERLVESFEVALEAATADVEDLVRELRAHGLADAQA